MRTNNGVLVVSKQNPLYFHFQPGYTHDVNIFIQTDISDIEYAMGKLDIQKFQIIRNYGAPASTSPLDIRVFSLPDSRKITEIQGNPVHQSWADIVEEEKKQRPPSPAAKLRSADSVRSPKRWRKL